LIVELKKCASGRGNDARVNSQITTWNAQLRASLSPLQTAWTSFDPYFYSGGSSSAGPALVKLTARSCVRDIESVTMPLLSIQDLVVAIFHQSGGLLRG